MAPASGIFPSPRCDWLPELSEVPAAQAAAVAQKAAAEDARRAAEAQKARLVAEVAADAEMATPDAEVARSMTGRAASTSDVIVGPIVEASKIFKNPAGVVAESGLGKGPRVEEAKDEATLRAEARAAAAMPPQVTVSTVS